MRNIKLYKTLSDDFEIIKLEEGTILKDAFPEIDWKKVRVIVNGYFKDEHYEVSYGDMISIRYIPGTLTTAAIIIGVVALVTGVVSGVAMYQMNKEAKKAQEELEKLQSQTTDSVTNLPWLKGSSNTVATGKTQPYIIGRHLFTPYILNGGGNNYKGYSTISGDLGAKQFYNVVLEGGFSNQVLNKIYCDDITLRNFDCSTIQTGKEPFATNSVFASAESYIEIAQNGVDFTTSEFKQKVVEQQPSSQLYTADDDNYTDLYFTLEQNSMSADVQIMFNGLCHYNDEGVKGNRKRTITPSFSTDYADIVANGGDTSNAHWHEFTFETAKLITPAKTTTTKGYYTYEVTGGYNGWSKENIIRDVSNWYYSKGTDIRSDYDSLEITDDKRTKLLLGYKHKYSIILSKSVKTDAVYQTTLSNTIEGKFNSQIRFNAHVDFADLISSGLSSEDFYNYDSTKSIFENFISLSSPITIKVSTTDEESSSGSDVDDCYVQTIHSYCYDTDASKAAGSFVEENLITDRERALSTLIGLHIESTSSNEDKLSSIQVITSGVAPTWDSSNSKWLRNSDNTFAKSPTSNPASWLLEILISDCHTPSQLDESEIDLDSFGAWYEYCEENNIEANYVITQGMQKSSIFEMLTTLGHATMYQSIYGKIAIAIDETKENAVAVLNEQNLISFSYEKDMSRQPDGVKLTYVSEDNDFQNDSIIVMYDGSDPSERSTDCVIKEITANGITNYEQAYRYCLYVMRCARLRPKTVTANIGKEGLYFNPLDKVLIQHPSLKIGLGSAEIKALITGTDGIIGFELYDAVTLDTENDFNIVVECVSDTYSAPQSYAINGVDGRTTEIYLKSPIAESATVKPKVHNILSYGYEVETITSPMLISAIEPSDNGYTLTLVDYNEAIYDTSDEIPEYTPNITQPKKPLNGIPATVPSATLDQLATVKASVFNTQTVTLYKASETKLTSDDLPTESVEYDFSSDTLTPSEIDGWSREYPTDTDNTVYITSATAKSKEQTDTIEANEWVSPIPAGMNGENGYSTKSISLYIRQQNEPTSSDYPQNDVVYNFESGSLIGSLGNFSQSIPSVSSVDGVVYEIHATALTTGTIATIEPTDWSDATQITADEITVEDIKKIIEENPDLIASPAVVYCDYTYNGFAVDDSDIIPVDQSFISTFNVKQSNKDLDFTFGDFDLPSGFSAIVLSGGRLQITAKKGTKFNSATLRVPIIYREYDKFVEYDDGLGNYYASEDESTDYYGYQTYKDDYTTFYYSIGMTGVKGGVYLGAISATSSIPTSDIVLGDYFTWTGSTTGSELSETGSFIKGKIYAWNGVTWSLDESNSHAMTALSDVLSTNADTMATKANELAEKLAKNNQVLTNLLSDENTTFYDKLNVGTIASKEAFIDSLVSNSAWVGSLTADSAFVSELKSSTVVADAIYANEEFVSKISTNYLTITGGEGKIATAKREAISSAVSSANSSTDSKLESYTKTDAMDSLISSLGYTDDTNVNLLNAALSATASKTIIDGGLLKTDLIDVDSLFAKTITLKGNGLIQSSNFASGSSGFQIKADGTATFRSGTFNNISSDNATFTNASVSGKLNATAGFKYSHSKIFFDITGDDMATLFNNLISLGLENGQILTGGVEVFMNKIIHSFTFFEKEWGTSSSISFLVLHTVKSEGARLGTFSIYSDGAAFEDITGEGIISFDSATVYGGQILY